MQKSLTRTVAVNASALAAGRLVVAVLGIISVGISTRYLGLESYGALAAALGFVALANMLTDLGVWTIGAREIAKRPEETQRIVGALVTVGLALSLGAVVVGVGATFAIYGGEEDELIRRAILLLLITAPLAAPMGAAGAYFIAQQTPYLGMLASVVASVVTLAMLAVASALDWGFTGVVSAYLVAAVAQWVVIMALSARRIRIRPTFDLAVARPLLRWALPLGGGRVVHGLYWRIDIILLSILATKSEVGLYGLAYRMVDALSVLPTFVTITLLPEFARLTSHRARLEQIVEKAFGVMEVGALAILVPFVVFANEITELIGGSDFEEAAPVLRLLVIGVALTYLGRVLAEAIVAMNGQGRLFWMSLVLLPVNVLLNIILIPLWGASGAALAFALTEILHLAALAIIYRGFATLPRLWRAPRVLAAGAIMAAAAAAFKLLPVSGEGGLALILGLGVTLGLALYVCALYALKAMPPAVHTNLVQPVWARLRPG